MLDASAFLPALNLRGLGWAAAAVTVALAGVVTPAGSEPAGTMSAVEAHQRATAREIVLIDIRREDEWRQTGLPASGYAISMYMGQRRFLASVNAAVGGDRSKPIALICATGVRSAYIQGILRRQGYMSVLNVAEGMLGGRHGQGWRRMGLPVRAWTGRNAAPELPAR